MRRRPRGRRYVGTAAHGRSKTYRYYTGWSRARYGTSAGCDIHRFNADDLEAAVGIALLDFFTTSSDVIADAVAQFQALTPGDLTKISHRIRDILANGAPNARKAPFEALIYEITITADGTVKLSSSSRSPDTTKGWP